MVKGLDIFRRHFAELGDQYVLIGGTAATLAMAAAGLEFRATKDLDIVLHIEALTPGFGAALWAFVEQGGYEIRQASETGRPVLYRFQKPAAAGYPAVIELFCRVPQGIHLAPGAHLTPIPFDEAVASLSAILLDEGYYAFIIEGCRVANGLPWIGAEQLVPLKARAWLDISARKAAGEPADDKVIRKHANDVIRLTQLLAPGRQIALSPQITDDLGRFLAGLQGDPVYDPRQLGIHQSLAGIADRLREVYGLR